MRRRRRRQHEILPDEILLDGENKPGFDTYQLEGVIEQPINRSTLLVLKLCFAVIFLIIAGKLFQLQVVSGQEMLTMSEQNRIRQVPIFSERGIIYDRNDVELAWNSKEDEEIPFSKRAYIEDGGFGHVLGYVGYPTKDNAGFYWRDEIVGRGGVEQILNPTLAGANGQQLVETDALLNITDANTIVPPEHGANAHLSIDARVQSALHQSIREHASEYGYQGGVGVILNTDSGEVLTLTNYPEFSPSIMSEGDEEDMIASYFSSNQKPFLNRALSGLYTPGSTVKPFVALAALHEGKITEDTAIMSTGQIEVPNPYNPEEPAIFRDWKDGGHGISDVKKAIGESVNTFFYAISGGLDDIDGIGIRGIEKYITAFGLGKESGIDLGSEVPGTIPTPEWKRQVFNGDSWRLGDTYITSIGQFGFQVTPLQMTRGVAALANSGKLVTPQVVSKRPSVSYIEEPISTHHYQVVRDGMRFTVTDGTAQSLNVPYIDIAAKTGTAQVGKDNEFINSWVVGFFPYHDPRYAFALVMERGPNEEATRGASWVLRNTMDQLQENYPEFFAQFAPPEEIFVDQE